MTLHRRYKPHYKSHGRGSSPTIEDDRTPVPSTAHPTPTDSRRPRRIADFPTLPDALDYAALGEAGLNLYSGRGVLLEALPYRVLRQDALDHAHRLLGLDLPHGARVGLVAENDGDFVRLFFACQYAGLVPVPLPLPVAFAGREGYIASLRRMLDSSGAVACFAPAMLKQWLVEAADGLGMRMVGTAAELRAIEPAAGLPRPDPAGLSYLQFSSGSTRLPLGVAVTQTAIMANAAAIGRYGLDVRDGDRGTSWLPFYHDMGLVGFLLTPVACQISVDLLPTREFSRRPLVWLELISRNRGTLAYSPSFGYELCARKADSVPSTLDLRCWRVAGIGGDLIRPNALDVFARSFAHVGFGADAFVASYGMAEATRAGWFAPRGEGLCPGPLISGTREHQRHAVASSPDEDGREFVRCGHVLPGHDLEVRDERGRPLGERQVGTIFVRGPSIMSGYHGHPDETVSVLSADGWLDTGDLGYLLDDEIVVTGRVKDLLIVNGRNVWPQDLEWAAETEIAAVRSRDVVVFSVDDDEAEAVVALVQCRTSSIDERSALQAEATALFRRTYGVEVTVILVPPHSLPQTSSGKLSRTGAKRLLLSGAFDGTAVARSIG